MTTQTTTFSDDRLPDGFGWWKQPTADGGYTAHAYAIAAEPILRTVTFAGSVVGYVTRNRYDAEVLNTDAMLILDLDCENDHGGCPSDALFFAVRRDPHLVANLETYIESRLTDTSCSTRFDRLFRGQAPSWRLYRTRNGLRALCTSHRMDLGDPTIWADHDAYDRGLSAFMREALVDDAYRRIAEQQHLCRARLTPKPWRGDGRACEFWSTIGPANVADDLRALVEEHDRVSGALGTSSGYRLPLA